MPRPAHHAPEHQALVVNLPGGAANRLLHADRGRFQGAILGLMWLELLSVNGGSLLDMQRCILIPPAAPSRSNKTTQRDRLTMN